MLGGSLPPSFATTMHNASTGLFVSRKYVTPLTRKK